MQDLKKNAELWAESWKRADTALSNIRQKQLCEYDYEKKHLYLINEMLKWAYKNKTPRLTSGLAEQQRLFMKIRKKQHLNPLFEAGLEIQNVMMSQKWDFCFIGGLAVIRWGEIRMTQDIDLCLLSGFGNEEKYIAGLLDAFKSRISDTADFARANRVLLLSASNGVDIDVSLGGLPFEQQMIKRATPFRMMPDCTLTTCSAEDLIVLKAFADRFKDWADIEGILTRQKKMDIAYVIQNLKILCDLKEDTEIVNKLNCLINTIGSA